MTTLVHLLVLLVVSGTMLYRRGALMTTLVANAIALAVCSVLFGPSYVAWGLFIVATLI